MRLEWLEDILAVAETGSFIKAAERRHLTQSAFSRRIRSIEEHLGTELFDRSRKPVELKAAVRDRHREITELAAGLRELTEALRQQGRRAERRIVIAGQHAITTSIAPSVVQRLVTLHNLDVRLRSANREECYALLLTGQADVALLYVTERHALGMEASFVETQTLGTENLIPVFGSSGSLNPATVLSRAELPVIAYPRHVFLGKVLADEVWPSLRRIVALVPRAETALTLAALQLALVGVAVAWVPETLAARHILENRLVDLRSQLGCHRLDLVSVRSKGAKSRIEEEVWDAIIRQTSAT